MIGTLGTLGRSRVALVTTLVGALLIAPAVLTTRSAVGAATAANAFPRCSAPPVGRQITLVVGATACQELTTHLLGGGIAAPFEYYVPPQCAPTRRASSVNCPTLYLLHGFGGDYTEMLDTPGTTTSAWVQALDHTPPAGFESSPWTNADPSKWGSAPPLGVILVAPLGRTLPGGYGPGPGQDSYWVDWNPRYAKGGDQQRYDTPAPKFASFLLEELAPFVEDQLPTGTGRDWRAIAGVSLGGYGAYKNGLQHPDQWTTMMSVSGAHNFLFGPAPQPTGVTSPVGAQSPVPITYTPLPAATANVPAGAAPSQAGTFLTALEALGDPAADQAYFRGNMPPDLAMNARASAAGVSSFGIDGFVNDMVARQPSDLSSTPFEVIVFPMNVDMEEAFATEAVPNTFAIHQGNHSDVYRNAWFRGLEKFAYARLNHADGRGTPPPPPTAFDYRSISTKFTIWGWRFDVTRKPIEFLTLRSVTCSGLTLQGTGKVNVTIPTSCRTGLRGHVAFTIDLGPSGVTDDPAATGATPVSGRTATVKLSSLAPRSSGR
jgi:S-formylglutathione hydrolase FrmB